MRFKNTITGNLTLLAALAIVCVGMLTAGGCAAFEGSTADARAEWQGQIDNLTQQTEVVSGAIGEIRQALADYEEQLAGIDPDDPLVEQIQDLVSGASERLQVLHSYEARVQEQLSQAQERLDSIQDDVGGLSVGLQMVGGTAQSVGATIPGPWGAAIAGIGTIIGGIGGLAARRRRNELEQTVFAIEQAKRSSPSLETAFRDSGKDINAVMGPRVSATVRKIRKGA